MDTSLLQKYLNVSSSRRGGNRLSFDIEKLNSTKRAKSTSFFFPRRINGKMLSTVSSVRDPRVIYNSSLRFKKRYNRIVQMALKTPGFVQRATVDSKNSQVPRSPDTMLILA